MILRVNWRVKVEGAGQVERANAAQRTEALQRAQEHIDGLEERLFDLEGKVGGRGVAAMEARVEEMIVKVRNPDSKLRQPQGRFNHILQPEFGGFGDSGRRSGVRRWRTSRGATATRTACKGWRQWRRWTTTTPCTTSAWAYAATGIACWRLVHD